MKRYLQCLIVVAVMAGLVSVPPRSQQLADKTPKAAVSAQTVSIRTAPKKVPAGPARQSTPANSGGSCAREIKKYNWNQAVAHNVMMAESGGHAWRLNDNPATGDYSVGCFQINLFGANALSRPSEAWLKNAANNVSYAHGMWRTQGWGPWSHTTCRYKVACY